jgi:hypothetical protein
LLLFIGAVLMIQASVPSLSTLYRARKSSRFADVKRKKNHNHGKCDDCYRLTLRLKKLSGDILEKEILSADIKTHTDEVQYIVVNCHY